jgi:phosphotransferase system enzyme I (PtsP)
MGPADLMDYSYEHIRGLIIEDCTPTMHVVIVAKALNIPVIAKIHGVLKEIKIGETIAVNGEEAMVYVRPSARLINDYQKKSTGIKKVFAELNKIKDLPTETLDGVKINLAMNYGLDLDYEYIKPTKCSGIGLYRTEITFMSADKMPDVESQEQQYKKLFDAMGNKKIIFRSLDVGSDKFLPYWGELKEENPALGWRSIRITLDRRAILKRQIRAMLRAAADKELNVMFPMVSSLQEFLEAKETLMLEYEREKQRKNPTAKKVNVGIMIEVPSVLFQLDELLQQVDFVSVGTNDLYQFVFACDRGNPRLSDRYDVLSGPFLKLMKLIVDKSSQYKVYCSVCGEMAGNPLEAMVLIGLGYRNLSVSGASYAKVKKMIMSMKEEDVEDYVKSLLKSPKNSIRQQLLAYAYDHAIAID